MILYVFMGCTFFCPLSLALIVLYIALFVPWLSYVGRYFKNVDISYGM